MGKAFAVIGDPIDHSLSPNIHSAAFRELDLDSSYIAYRIPKGELEEGIAGLKKIEIYGFNVTIPHKVEMMKYLEKIDESCSVIGAVNTVVNDNGVFKGYNTDMDGFLDPFKKKNLKIIDKCNTAFGSRRSCKGNCCRICKRKGKENDYCKQNFRKCK